MPYHSDKQRGIIWNDPNLAIPWPVQKPIKSSKLNMNARRPNANLSNKKVEKDTGINFVTISEGLEIMKASGNIF